MTTPSPTAQQAREALLTLTLAPRGLIYNAQRAGEVGYAQTVLERFIATHATEPAAPEGFVVVPREPTEAMLDRVRERGGVQAVAYAIAVWPDMLAAAPTPPAQPGDAGWRDDTPDVPAGDSRYLIVTVQRAHNDKRYSFPAAYANALPLDWGRDGEETQSEAGNGYRIEAREDDYPLCTGWFDIKGRQDDEDFYQPLLSEGDKLIAWRALPPPLLASPAPASLDAAADGWRPIETAPKDGTRVLVAEPGSTGSHIAHLWGEGWWIEERADLWTSKPTHWMPLPEPPK